MALFLLSALLCAGAIVTAALHLAPLPQVEHTTPAAQLFEPQDTVFALQPIGEVPGLLVRRHAQLIETRFASPVHILEPLALPEVAWSSERQQLDATLLLDELYIHKPPGVTHVIGVTSEDLFATDWDFLYGYSQVEGRVAVYSTARLAPRGEPLGPLGLASERAEKIIVHELGHTFGLEHCPTPHCMMNTVEQARGLERMSRFFCGRCARQLDAWQHEDAREAVASARTGPDAEAARDPAVRRGDGLYARGAFDRAWMRYVTGLLARPTSAAHLNRVGVASAELGKVDSAHLAYRLAILRAPDYPLPYYNFGLLYAAVDASRSAALLQAGFERDPDRVEALGYLGSVYAEVLGDEHRALYYFQRYVREGGHEPSVLVRYRRLVRPSVFEFDDGEVGIIRSNSPRAEPSLSETLVWQLMRAQWLLGALAPD